MFESKVPILSAVVLLSSLFIYHYELNIYHDFLSDHIDPFFYIEKRVAEIIIRLRQQKE